MPFFFPVPLLFAGKVENLSLSKKQLLKMVLKFPKLLDYGVEASYAPLVEWFRSHLGLNTREVHIHVGLGRVVHYSIRQVGVLCLVSLSARRVTLGFVIGSVDTPVLY